MSPAAEPPLADRTAAAIAATVRSGAVSPVDVVRACFDRIHALDASIGAFQLLREDRALAEAEAVALRADRGELPLAGVPIAVKDNLDVEGVPTRYGSSATPDRPAAADHEVVRRVRAAGAIVVGKTRIPELGVWPMTDGPLGVTCNPWRHDRVPGGSSGGSAAAVAAGMVPVAIGNDGLGSLRIPAACCGLVTIKPGEGVVPADIGRNSWFSMAENGPLATTVEDAALLYAVLAGQEPGTPLPQDRLRIALSTRSPAAGVRVDPAWARATEETAELLRGAGHVVERADPSYPLRFVPAIFAHWMGGGATDAEGLDRSKLDPRTRVWAAMGRRLLRLGAVKREQRAGWRDVQLGFFRRFELLLTPTLATIPPPLDDWRHKGWLANVVAATRFAPFPGAWNFAGFPAAAVPAGMHPEGLPLSVQLVGAPGAEHAILGVAAELERLRPWPRHAPTGAGVA